MNPFVDALPREVPLPHAPIERVLCQVRFPEALSVESKETVARFQTELYAHYPVLRQEQNQGLVIGPEGLVPAKIETAWRFHDIEGNWRVSLTPTFVALETTKYPSRTEFVDRLRLVLTALERHVNPAVVDRIGLRYVDRLTDEAVKKLPELVRPEVLGVLCTDVAENVVHSASETLFNLDNGQMLARWGKLPAGTTTDPNVLSPVNGPSWILDVDTFTSGAPQAFKASAVLEQVEKYAEKIYAFFRWAIKDDFLRFYGGKI